MPPKKPSNRLTVPMFLKIDSEVSQIKEREEVRDARLEILEKHAREMQSIPATVSGLNAKVESLSATVTREVDGVREQNKAHKNELMEQLELTSSSIGNGMRTLSTQVNALVGKEQTASAIKRFLLKIAAYIGGILASAAAIAEIVRAFKGA